MTTDDRGPVLRRAPAERERLAEVIADRLDGPMTALGIVFVLMVIAETVIEPKGALSTAFTVGGWVLWATFVAELYAVALHDAAYATVTGEPLSADTGLARVMELVLATYSVVVFAALAGMLGAYFVQSRGADAHDGALDAGA